MPSDVAMTDAPGAASAAAVAEGMARSAAAVETVLEQLLPTPHGHHARVLDAMRYATFAGGKRLRPYLVVAGARLFDVPKDRALRAAAAIEVLHTYSLVHDDLPAMDDDDLRRGRPTTHKQFDEATAILAGDGLLTIAFEILADAATHPSGEVRARLVSRLAKAAGGEGMIGGQMMDIAAPNNDYGKAEIILLQRMKTGALFEFSAEAGPILAEAGADDQARLRRFAQDLGLAFQIADDLIDATGHEALAGKAVGKDAEQGKATFITLHGLDGARREAKTLAERASDTLASYGPAANELRQLPFFLLGRAS